MRFLLALSVLAFAAAPAVAPAQGKKKTKATPAAVASADTSKTAASDAWVASASSKKKEYYKAGCTKANGIKPKNVLHFKTEADAKAAGYARSKMAGC